VADHHLLGRLPLVSQHPLHHPHGQHGGERLRSAGLPTHDDRHVVADAPDETTGDPASVELHRLAYGKRTVTRHV
jgi:hypothetical protein